MAGPHRPYCSNATRNWLKCEWGRGRPSSPGTAQLMDKINPHKGPKAMTCSLNSNYQYRGAPDCTPILSGGVLPLSRVKEENTRDLGGSKSTGSCQDWIAAYSLPSGPHSLQTLNKNFDSCHLDKQEVHRLYMYVLHNKFLYNSYETSYNLSSMKFKPHIIQYVLHFHSTQIALFTP